MFPAQPECSNPALKAHERPVLMQLLDLIFLLLRLLCISEKQPGGSCLSLRAADHRTMILRDKANIRNASDAYVDSIRAEIVSICALLYKLLAAVAPWAQHVLEFEKDWLWSDCFTSVCSPVQQFIGKDNADVMEVHWRRMSLEMSCQRAIAEKRYWLLSGTFFKSARRSKPCFL